LVGRGGVLSIIRPVARGPERKRKEGTGGIARDWTSGEIRKEGPGWSIIHPRSKMPIKSATSRKRTGMRSKGRTKTDSGIRWKKDSRVFKQGEAILTTGVKEARINRSWLTRREKEGGRGGFSGERLKTPCGPSCVLQEATPPI